MADRDHDNPGLPVLPPVLPAAALALAIVLDWLPPHILAPPVGFNLQVIAGAVILAAALWFGISAVRLFGKAGTNVIPTQPTLTIVTGGPYRFSRNPMYLGMVLALLGLSLIFSLEWGVILTPVLWLALDRLIVVREEAYLRRKFGATYEALLDRTRRWL
ncbi:methyltransferase family protein [Phreatobacter stygius]|uniref:Isoprenylcysteine carboxylmethyltransferase family protein n=1 Tax=Phreatobacter stygius TaxID=1940610 RepID=A0A4D7AZ18_9HYPH|nr:isoprenylcysteine carboxylmethyltransferase family protein [Phreatobacter stygius]QCI62940.1 isoprenylcysteine carboxylmethyltransferase family protein [Phreatobacter stygius]